MISSVLCEIIFTKRLLMQEPTHTTRLQRTVRQAWEDLSAQERKVAQYLLDHEGTLLQEDLGSIAAHSGVSNACVVRCCKSLGFQGLKGLKIAMGSTLLPKDVQEIEWKDSEQQVCEKMLRGSSITLAEAFSAGSAPFEAAGRLVANADTIAIIAVGGSCMPARFCFTQMQRLGKHASLHEDAYAMERLCNPCTSLADLLIAFSCSGKTEVICRAATTCKTRGTHVLCFTCDEESPLAKVADVVITAPSHPVFYDDEHSYTRVAQIAQITTLYFCAALRMGAARGSWKTNYVRATNYRSVP